jgi:hypothetical protein
VTGTTPNRHSLLTETERERERAPDCMRGTHRMDGWMDGWLSVRTVRYKRLTSRVIRVLAYRHLQRYLSVSLQNAWLFHSQFNLHL